MPTNDPPEELWRCWRALWKRRNSLGGHAIGLACVALMFLLIGGGYLLTLRIALWRDASVADTRSFADEWFQATPWAVAIYVSLYLYFPVTVLIAPRTRDGWVALILNLQAQLWLALLSFSAFLVAPTFLHARAEMEAELEHASGWTSYLFEHIYSLDAPYNAWPSLHVSLSLVMVLTSQRLMRGRFSRALIFAWWPAWLALLWSILATKQHHAFDIWTGALVGTLAWCFYLAPRLSRAAPSLSTGPQRT